MATRMTARAFRAARITKQKMTAMTTERTPIRIGTSTAAPFERITGKPIAAIRTTIILCALPAVLLAKTSAAGDCPSTVKPFK